MTNGPQNHGIEQPLLEWVAAVAKVTKPDVLQDSRRIIS